MGRNLFGPGRTTSNAQREVIKLTGRNGKVARIVTRPGESLASLNSRIGEAQKDIDS